MEPNSTEGEELQLISDGDGLAVIGDAKAVKRLLRSEGLWVESTNLDLGRVRSFLGAGADIAQAASEWSANSARWIKLTPESAYLRKKYGLTATKTPGISHVMIGKPGRVKNWLQVDQGVGSLVTNPAALSGIGGIMAQAAIQQAISEITDYLKTIDLKVDDVLRKVDDTVVAQVVGAGHTIERALTIRDETGSVNETLWSTVDQTHQTIGATQAYALEQLNDVARKLEETKVRDLADAARSAEQEVPKWLAVLARCFQLQDAVDVIELDRVFAESPHELDAYRRGLSRARADRRELVSDRTGLMLTRMDAAVATANARFVWSREKSLLIVDTANRLSAGIDDFHGLLTIEANRRSWKPRQLSRAADVASQAIQQTKDKGPAVVGTVALAATAFGASKKYGSDSKA